MLAADKCVARPRQLSSARQFGLLAGSLAKLIPARAAVNRMQSETRVSEDCRTIAPEARMHDSIWILARGMNELSLAQSKVQQHHIFQHIAEGVTS